MAVSRILKSGWRFRLADDPGFAAPSFDDSAWQPVNVPHDWAISGPFDKKNDLYSTRIVQDGETAETLHYVSAVSPPRRR